MLTVSLTKMSWDHISENRVVEKMPRGGEGGVLWEFLGGDEPLEPSNP